MAWLRYRVAKVAVRWGHYGRYSQLEDRYPRTVAGGWRYFREQVCPAEVEWYERQHPRRGGGR